MSHRVFELGGMIDLFYLQGSRVKHVQVCYAWHKNGYYLFIAWPHLVPLVRDCHLATRVRDHAEYAGFYQVVTVPRILVCPKLRLPTMAEYFLPFDL